MGVDGLQEVFLIPHRDIWVLLEQSREASFAICLPTDDLKTFLLSSSWSFTMICLCIGKRIKLEPRGHIVLFAHFLAYRGSFINVSGISR